MLLKETFLKDIYRPIDPVVKANELGHLKSELEEFVVTNEAKSHLQRFFDEYNDPDSAGNGAWISGFFGSGKSHLLKIMAVVMEDRQVDGKGAMGYILPKLADNPALSAAMEQSRQRHPSESVLFNIDSFAPNAGRSEAGAILSAFIKAFNHHCGYFDGDQQHIAKLEYDLDREGHLESFKGRVEELCGKPWEQVRSSSLLYGKKITAAFDEVCGNPEGTTDNVISYYQQTYKPDIRMFAKRVADYIDERGDGFRLNFFVDEVGQFIAQNTSLMVNLQTIAEELDNFCKGDSWVIVTSQENVEDVVGQMKQISANDFSKIKDRFKTRMVLTSSDAKEVIRDRLLAKKPEDEPELEGIYEEYRADFDVLFDFADGAKRYRQYQSASEFCDTYPFVPYQFEVFMTALRGLSDHNCFTGRHNSTGARSMLGVFQMVAQRICNEGASTEQGTLAPFDMMFEGLRNDLKSEVYAAISTAEDQLDDETAVRLLKALLLVKYCQDFRATPGNLRELLYGQSFYKGLHVQSVDQVICRNCPDTGKKLPDTFYDTHAGIRDLMFRMDQEGFYDLRHHIRTGTGRFKEKDPPCQEAGHRDQIGNIRHQTLEKGAGFASSRLFPVHHIDQSQAIDFHADIIFHQHHIRKTEQHGKEGKQHIPAFLPRFTGKSRQPERDHKKQHRCLMRYIGNTIDLLEKTGKCRCKNPGQCRHFRSTGPDDEQRKRKENRAKDPAAQIPDEIRLDVCSEQAEQYRDQIAVCGTIRLIGFDQRLRAPNSQVIEVVPIIPVQAELRQSGNIEQTSDDHDRKYYQQRIFRFMHIFPIPFAFYFNINHKSYQTNQTLPRYHQYIPAKDTKTDNIVNILKSLPALPFSPSAVISESGAAISSR